MSQDDTRNPGLSRRAIMKMAGTAMVGVWSRNASAAVAGQKPTYLVPDDVTDAAVHSRAENLFWCDIMAEHAGFFAMLMPGAELAAQRAQAENFQRSFQTQFDRAKSVTLDRTNYAAFNRSTMELLKPFIEYKQRMREAQETGKIRTLVFPLFFSHTAREAERAAARLERLAAGNAMLDFTEVIDFWSAAMGDHSELIAHFLDPQEQELISQALDSSALFQGFHHANRDRKLPGAQVLIATEEMIDFKTAIEDGVNTGRVKSILHPTLAGHMQREALKFADEIKRSASRT